MTRSYEESEARGRELCMKLDDMAHLEEENRRLRIVVSTIETMIGRKFDNGL